jgi:hypothetical protein
MPTGWLPPGMVNSSRLTHQETKRRVDETGALKSNSRSAYPAANRISHGIVFLRSDFGKMCPVFLIYGPNG